MAGGPEQTGRPWWPRTVGTLIRNPTYIGRRCAQDPKTRAYGRTLLRCEPLVDAAVFRDAGRALDGRPKRGHIDPANRAMLAGVLFCPRCENSPDVPDHDGHGRQPHRLLPVHRARRCPQGLRQHGARRAGGRRREPDHHPAYAIPVMEQQVVPGNAAEIGARLEEIKFEMRQLGAADLDDEEHDRQAVGAARRAGPDQGPAGSFPTRYGKTATGEVYAD